jgi:hypothetical protein
MRWRPRALGRLGTPDVAGRRLPVLDAAGYHRGLVPVDGGLGMGPLIALPMAPNHQPTATHPAHEAETNPTRSN